ncbi:MAG: prepilin peptidase [Velocimicrobium sp.]
MVSAVLCDLQTWKIRNEIIFCGLAIGLYYMFREGNYKKALIGFIIPIIILWPLFYIRALGAGDIKLLAVLGIFYGYDTIPVFIPSAFVFGAILSILQLIHSGNLNVRLQYFYCYISKYVTTKKIIKYYNVDREGRKSVIHFSIAILLAHIFFLLQTG